MTAKTAKPAATEAKVEAKVEEKITETVTSSIEDATTKARTVFSSLGEVARLAMTNTIAVDKMILNHVGTSAKGAVAHGRTIMGAKDIKSVFELQTAFVQNAFEQNLAATREVLEVAQAKAKETIAPLAALKA